MSKHFAASILLATVCICLTVRQASAQVSLDAAVADVQQIIAAAGLPADFMPRGFFDPEEVDPLFLTGAWEQIHREAAERFGRGFGLPRQPRGVLVCEARTEKHLLQPGERHLAQVVFQGSNAAFEETVLRAVYGYAHSHFDMLPVKATETRTLPNIRDRYLLANGAVNFGLITEDFANLIDARIPNSCDRAQTQWTNTHCTLFTLWLNPGNQSRDWIHRLLRWRIVYRVRSISGHSIDMSKIYNGPRRLIVESFIEIGFRRSPAEPINTVFAAGPLHQEAFRPIGFAELGSEGWHLSFRETNMIDNALNLPGMAFSDRGMSLTEDKDIFQYPMVAAEESHLVDFAKDLQLRLTQQLRF